VGKNINKIQILDSTSHAIIPFREKETMLKNFVKLFSSDPTKKTVSQLGDLAEQVNALESQFADLSDEQLRA